MRLVRELPLSCRWPVVSGQCSPGGRARRSHLRVRRGDTQLALGIGRDDPRLTQLFDERRPTVKRLVRELVEKAHAAGRPVGICGQAPSDHPEFAEFLVEQGIDSLSLNPDSGLDVVHRVSDAESPGEAERRPSV